MTKSELLAAADALAWAARDDVSKGAMMERAREFHAQAAEEGYIFVNATANKAAALLPIGHYDLYTVPPALAAEVARLRGLLGEAQIHVLARDLHDRIEAAIKENNT